MTTPPSGLQVQPERVIGILKNRLTQEIATTALLEAALQESQLREQMLSEALTTLQRQAAEAEDANKPAAADPRVVVRGEKKP